MRSLPETEAEKHWALPPRPVKAHGPLGMSLVNREGHREFDIPTDWHRNRKPGLSGLVRLRDEATWCQTAIESFLDWCDELVIVVQPSVDETREIVEQFRGDEVKILDYLFQSHPSGPGHDGCSADSVYASAYYYNWTLAQSERTHVVKLDGDLVMMDWAGEKIRSLMTAGHDRIKFEGRDLVGEELRHVGCHPKCPTDGVFKVTPDVHYIQGQLTQKLVCRQTVTHTIAEPAFVHMKWAKPVESAIKRWPSNWRGLPHFQRIYARREPVAIYEGEYPASVAAML